MDDIVKVWNTSDFESSNERISALANRLRNTDLCLILFQRKVKKLMVAWDVTCFGLSPDDPDYNKVKKTTRPSHLMATRKRYLDSKSKGSLGRKKIVKDSRYIPPDPVNTACQKQGRSRIFYTEEEDKAILEGEAKFGWGNWAEIKLAYANELKQRDNVSIKDRANILKKHGIIQERAFIGGHFV